MRLRVLSAAVLAPIAVALVVLGGLPFLAGILVMCLVALWELTGLLGAAAAEMLANRAWRYLTLAAGGLLLAGVYADHFRSGAAQAAAAALLVASLAGLVLGGAPAKRILEWAAGAAGIVYICGLGSHFILLRESDRGLAWTLLACLVTWCTDIGALFAGKYFGTHPFFPSISPKKTVEGAIGGLLAGMVVAVPVMALGDMHAPLSLGPLIGLSISVSAQAGDLVESLVKREAGVKDSGTIIPGHGGVLDRIDSLLFAIALTYYWRILFP
jgi:phosphatidate cytidylyltransferase